MNQYRFGRLRAELGSRARSMSVGSALACALVVSSGALAPEALAQVSRAPAAPPAVGLDSLSDDAVMSELSGMKLDSLLNHMFEANHVPKDKQESIKSLGALRELAASDAISNGRRILLVKRAVDGLSALLPTMSDPTALMTYTGQLVDKGIGPDINTLEYWGENPTLQARVKPAADIASKMLEQVSTQAETQANQIENTLHGANDPRADLWDKLDKLKDQAKYYDNMIAYYRAMAIDTSGGANKAAVAERAKICDKAIKFLIDPFDQPGSDGGGVQPLVHNRIGKLEMAKGDYSSAKSYFNAMIIGKTPDGKAIDPAANAGQIYEARYFLVLCDVLGKKPDVAEKELADLDAWQKKNLPAEAQSGVDAAADMLRYRMFSAKADLAKSQADKDELNKQADGVLTALEKTHPEFTALITEQLVTRLPETANLNEQGVSVLQALIAKGNAERFKPEAVPMDEKVVNRALAAAKVLITRKEGVTPREVQETTLFIAMLLDKQNKPVDAANAYLDFAGRYALDPNAGPAVDRAVTLAYPLGHGAEKDDPPIKKLYGRALSTAANPPWSRTELAYFYADYLRSVAGKPHDAVAFYKKVPPGDKMEFPARFFELVAISQELDDTKLPPADREKDIAEATALVDQIRQLAPSAAQNDTTKSRLAASTLLGASFAIQAKQPAKALQLLANFDAEAAAIPKQTDQLVPRATFYRAQAYIADKKFDAATSEVIKLSAKSPDAAKDLATSLLDQLGKDFDRYQANHQATEMAETAANEAKLTNFMVSFCENSKDQKIKDLTPLYQLYDAKMKLNAGNLAFGADRTQKLNDALTAYQRIKLLRPEDTNAAYGVGLTQFALGQWAEASATLGTLLKDGKLGGPELPETDKVTGEQSFKENPAYWEATYKWIKSKFEQSKGLPNDPTMQQVLASAKQALRDDFTNYKESTGGEKWATQFEELRKEMVPEFDYHELLKSPTSSPSTSPTSAPVTTQPVAAGIGK